MGGIAACLWVIGFIASIAFFIASIADYRKNKKSIKPIVISGIVSCVLGVPVVLVVVLMVGLSTGLVGM